MSKLNTMSKLKFPDRGMILAATSYDLLEIIKREACNLGYSWVPMHGTISEPTCVLFTKVGRAVVLKYNSAEYYAEKYNRIKLVNVEQLRSDVESYRRIASQDNQAELVVGRGVVVQGLSFNDKVPNDCTCKSAEARKKCRLTTPYGGGCRKVVKVEPNLYGTVVRKVVLATNKFVSAVKGLFK